MSAKTTNQKEKTQAPLYTLTIKETVGSSFYPEYFVLTQSVQAVNLLNQLYWTQRKDKKGPSEQWEQDIYRAMLIFACAGLDVFLKRLIVLKLPTLIKVDEGIEKKFQEYVLSQMQRRGELTMSTLALALITEHPRKVFLEAYVESFTGGSLQSADELERLSHAFALPTKQIIKGKRSKLDEAFKIRNSIIHEMDINVQDNGARGRGYRTRQQRKYEELAGYSKLMFELSEEIFVACKEKFKSESSS